MTALNDKLRRVEIITHGRWSERSDEHANALKIGAWNARSCAHTFNAVVTIAEKMDFDVLCVQEAGISSHSEPSMNATLIAKG